MMHPVMLEDCQRVCESAYIPWEKLRDKTVLITGATGLIGKNLVQTLLCADHQRDLHLKLVLLARSQEKVQEAFGDLEGADVCTVIGDVTSLPELDVQADYIVHAASPTASTFFMNHPAETMQTMVMGTQNILELGRKWNVKGIVYLSTMEVYGHPAKGHVMTEQECAGFDTFTVRNCYPISKQACECLCNAYATEYQLPVMCMRLTQTFGAGVAYQDTRVFAQFMRCAMEGQDIVLKTKGETERCYLYTADCTAAILTVLLKGTAGSCYNAANPETYCSILEMAQMVASEVADGKINVRIEEEDITRFGYANTLYMQLDCSKLEALGWRPTVKLADMFRRMIQSQDHVQ
jgi:nucleoside-diphosphate-sugar epimerase